MLLTLTVTEGQYNALLTAVQTTSDLIDQHTPDPCPVILEHIFFTHAMIYRDLERNLLKQAQEQGIAALEED